MKNELVLAYSGGLDTSCAVHHLAETGYEVTAMLVDVGQPGDLDALAERALSAGASDTLIIDAKTEFAEEHILQAIMANAMYEGAYPLSTALTRPLLAKHLVRTAVSRGADVIAHGCTGKGNDQVRLEVAAASLAPHLRILAPIRDWAMSREEEVDYALKHGIDIDTTKEKIYSIDENMFGRSIEGGCLEDPWCEPPEEVFLWTKGSGAGEVELEFASGAPTTLNGASMPLEDIVMELNALAGGCGIGRIDHIESRVVGIKSREVYECPAAVVLIAAHTALEKMVLPRDLLSFKRGVDQAFTECVYDGRWFSPLMRSLRAFILSTQERVSGKVRVKMRNGAFRVTGVSSPYALYTPSLATYDPGSTFDQAAAEGFIYVVSLPYRSWGVFNGTGKGTGASCGERGRTVP